MTKYDPEQLERDGWTRRFSATEPRLSEAADNYRDLGLEVLLVPALDLCDRAGEESCNKCFENDPHPERHKVIFTRPL